MRTGTITLVVGAAACAGAAALLTKSWLAAQTPRPAVQVVEHVTTREAGVAHRHRGGARASLRHQADGRRPAGAAVAGRLSARRNVHQRGCSSSARGAGRPVRHRQGRADPGLEDHRPRPARLAFGHPRRRQEGRHHPCRRCARRRRLRAARRPRRHHADARHPAAPTKAAKVPPTPICCCRTSASWPSINSRPQLEGQAGQDGDRRGRYRGCAEAGACGLHRAALACPAPAGVSQVGEAQRIGIEDLLKSKQRAAPSPSSR